MSSNSEDLRSDFTASSRSKSVPSDTEEIEVKFNMASQRDLHILIQALVDRGLASYEFYKHNPEPYYSHPHDVPLILHTNPVSHYLDDELQTLRGQTDNLRIRLTPAIPGRLEWGVKGHAMGFDGPGGVIRHEDEKITDSLAVRPSQLFDDPKTLEILKLIKEHPLYFYFATDVKRQVIGVPVEVYGKTALFEICADPIHYVRFDTGPNEPLIITPDTDILSLPTVEFYELNQLEVEHFNPNQSDPEMAELARLLELDTMTKNEVQRALHRINQTVRDVASDIGLATTKITTKSKATTGFEELEKAGHGPAARLEIGP